MAQSQKLNVAVRRSQLGRVRGLGSAKSGTTQWWAERVGAIALVPLTIWFVISALGHLGASQAEMVAWLSQLVNAALMLALVLATFHHLALGMQVVVEDYVHEEGARFACLLAIRGLAWFCALASLVSVLKLALAARLG